jgi:hypothetical protein
MQLDAGLEFIQVLHDVVVAFHFVARKGLGVCVC